MQQSAMPYYLYSIITYIIIDNFYFHILTKRKCIRHPYLACFLLQIVPVFTLMFVFGLTVPVTFILIVFLLLPCIAFFEGRLSLRLCAFFLSYLIIFISELLDGFIFLLLNLIFFKKDIPPGSQILMQNMSPALSCLFLTLTLVTIYLIFRKLTPLLEKHYMSLNPSLIIKSGGPLAVIVISTNFIYALDSLEKVLIFICPYLIIYIVCIPLIRSSFKALEQQEVYNEQMRQEKEQIGKELAYFNERDRQFQIIRKWNHDISNHLLSLTYLIEQNKTDAAQNYLDALLTARERKEEEDI